MQNLCLAGHSEMLLDSRSTAKKRSPTSGTLPICDQDEETAQFLQGNSASLFCSPQTLLIWCLAADPVPLLNGGKDQRRGSRSNTEKVLTPYVPLEPGYCGSIGMLVFFMGWPQICRLQFKLIKMNPTYGNFWGPRGLTTLCLEMVAVQA